MSKSLQAIVLPVEKNPTQDSREPQKLLHFLVCYLVTLVARNQQSKKLWENKLRLSVTDLA